jgi:hypothetical protein
VSDATDAKVGDVDAQTDAPEPPVRPDADSGIPDSMGDCACEGEPPKPSVDAGCFTGSKNPSRDHTSLHCGDTDCLAGSLCFHGCEIASGATTVKCGKLECAPTEFCVVFGRTDVMVHLQKVAEVAPLRVSIQGGLRMTF